MKWNRIAIVRIGFWGASGLVLLLSLLPTEQLPPITLDIWDKAQHALGFLFLGVLGFWSYAHRHMRVLLGLLIFGAAIELMQSVTGWRHGDWLDWLADALGVVVAYFLFYELSLKNASQPL
jgi:VanZ family protein